MSEDKLTHDIELVLEGENINLPVGSGFYPSEAEEPYFVVRSRSCSQSIAFPLSQLVAAVEERGLGISIQLKKVVE